MIPGDAQSREARRRQALAGGYRLRTATGAPAATLVGVGAVDARGARGRGRAGRRWR